MTAPIDLSRYVGQRVFATLRSGALVVDDLTASNLKEWPYRFRFISYNSKGSHLSDGSPGPSDIIAIRPASDVIISEWITDRRPTEADGVRGGFVLFRDSRDLVCCSFWTSVCDGMAWAHQPGWTPPDPEIDPRATLDTCNPNAFNVLANLERRTALTMSKDGNKWCILHGNNLQEGAAGFGDTPEKAMKDFLKSYELQHLTRRIAALEAGE